MASTILYKTPTGYTLVRTTTEHAVVGVFAYSIDARGDFSKVKRGDKKPGGKNVYFIPNDGVKLPEVESALKRGRADFNKQEGGLSLGARITLSQLGKFVEVSA